MRMRLSFGWMADPLARQLREQGLPVPEAKVLRAFQDDDKAITRLRIRGCLSDGESVRARRRLTKRILTEVSRER